MKDKPYKVKISVSLDEDVVNKIKDLAEKDDRTVSSFLNKIIKDFIEKDRWEEK